MSETPTDSIDPVGNAGLALNALRQHGGVPLDLLKRVEAGLTEALRRSTTEVMRAEEAVAQTAIVQQRLDLATADLTESRRRANTINDRFTLFKTEVRDKAIEVAAEQDWCDEGLNAALKELGLEPVSRTYVVDGYVEVTRRRFRIEVEDVADGEAAEEAARVLATDPSEWESSFWHDDPEFQFISTNVERETP